MSDTESLERADGDEPQPAPAPMSLASAVRAALELRKVKPRCAECGKAGFDRFHFTPVPAVTATAAQGQTLVSAALVCKTCGATKLYNLNVLEISVQQEGRRVLTPGEAARAPGQSLIVAP